MPYPCTVVPFSLAIQGRFRGMGCEARPFDYCTETGSVQFETGETTTIFPTESKMNAVPHDF